MEMRFFSYSDVIQKHFWVAENIMKTKYKKVLNKKNIFDPMAFSY